ALVGGSEAQQDGGDVGGRKRGADEAGGRRGGRPFGRGGGEARGRACRRRRKLLPGGPWGRCGLTPAGKRPDPPPGALQPNNWAGLPLERAPRRAAATVIT